MELTTADYVAILRRRAAVVVAVLALTVLAIASLSVSSASTYSATTEVFVTPIIEPVSNTPQVAKRDTLVNLGTEQRLATSLAVAEQVRTNLAIDDVSARALRSKVFAAQIPETELLRISYSDDEPEIAKERSKAWAQTYLALRQERAAASRRTVTDDLEDDIDAAVEAIAVLNATIAETEPGTPERFNADAQREAKVSELQILQDNLVKVKTSSLDPGQIVTEPQNAAEQQTFGKKELAVLLVVGITAAIALAIAVERLDRRVRGVADLAGTGVRVLGTLSRTRADADAANRLRNVLVHGETTPKRIVVSGDDDSATAIVGTQLARAFASAGTSTLVVGSNPVAGDVEKAFGVGAAPGVSDVVVGDATLADAISAVGGSGSLSVLPSGSANSWRPGLLARPAAMRALDDAAQSFDVVIIVAPSVLSSSNALDVSADADAVLLVVGHRGANADRVTTAVSEFARSGSDTTGAVLVSRK